MKQKIMLSLMSPLLALLLSVCLAGTAFGAEADTADPAIAIGQQDLAAQEIAPDASSMEAPSNVESEQILSTLGTPQDELGWPLPELSYTAGAENGCFPPSFPPPSCQCGSCCECNKCWRGSVIARVQCDN